VIEAAVAVEVAAEVAEATSSRAASGTPAGLLLRDALQRSGGLREMLTRTHLVVVAMVAEAEVAVVPGRGPYLSRAPAHHLAEDSVRDHRVTQSFPRGLAVHQAGEEEVQQHEEDQSLVTDPQDPLLGQTHHAHQHLEDAAIQADHLPSAAVEAHPDAHDDRPRAPGRVLGQHHVVGDGLVIT
jgi:hypothetical protein